MKFNGEPEGDTIVLYLSQVPINWKLDSICIMVTCGIHLFSYLFHKPRYIAVFEHGLSHDLIQSWVVHSHSAAALTVLSIVQNILEY